MGDMYMQTKSRYQTARRILLFWTLFIGVGAAAGAAGMLLDPSGKAMGMDAMLPYFQVLPFADVLFRDLTFSGWALLIVNGLTNLTAASLLLAKKNAGITLGGLFGVTLMLWIRIQFYMFPPNFMSTIYFMFGFAQAAPVRARRSAACQKSPITIDIVLLRRGGRLCPPGRLQLILRKAAAHTHALPVSVQASAPTESEFSGING